MTVDLTGKALFWVDSSRWAQAAIVKWEAGEYSTIDLSEPDPATLPGGKRTGTLRAVGNNHLVGGAWTYAQKAVGFETQYLHDFDITAMTGPIDIGLPVEESVNFQPEHPFYRSYPHSHVGNYLGGWYDPVEREFWFLDYFPIHDGESLTGEYIFAVYDENMAWSRWAGAQDPMGEILSVRVASSVVHEHDGWLYWASAKGYRPMRYHRATEVMEISFHWSDQTPTINPGYGELVGVTDRGVFFARSTDLTNETTKINTFQLEVYAHEDVVWYSTLENVTGDEVPPRAAPQQVWPLPIPAPDAYSPWYLANSAYWMRPLDNDTMLFVCYDYVNPVTNNGGAGTAESPFIEQGEYCGIWALHLTDGTFERVIGMPYYWREDPAITAPYGYAGEGIGLQIADAVILAAEFTWELDESGRLVHFDASSSTGEVVTYSWDFDEHYPVVLPPQVATGEQVDHLFYSLGPFEVTLTVTDAEGVTASVTHEVDLTASVISGAYDNDRCAFSDG